MFKNFVEKRVEIVVLLSGSFRGAGSVPVIYIGTVVSSDEKLTILNLSSKYLNVYGIIGLNSQPVSGIIAINNTYIISVREV